MKTKRHLLVFDILLVCCVGRVAEPTTVKESVHSSTQTAFSFSKQRLIRTEETTWECKRKGQVCSQSKWALCPFLPAAHLSGLRPIYYCSAHLTAGTPPLPPPQHMALLTWPTDQVFVLLMVIVWQNGIWSSKNKCYYLPGQPAQRSLSKSASFAHLEIKLQQQPLKSRDTEQGVNLCCLWLKLQWGNARTVTGNEKDHILS